jgi:hypothetical protein
LKTAADASMTPKRPTTSLSSGIHRSTDATAVGKSSAGLPG